MPFTLAHPAAVLPLRRVRLMRTVPLIIGAMTPDAPYFTPWHLSRHAPELTHSFLGTFTLDLPIGLVMLALLWLLRAPLAAPLWPSAEAKCFCAMERFGKRPGNWMLAPLSILIGAWTHVLWDSFTHADGWMVSRISALSAPVSFFSYTGQLCHVLQYASSVFGLAVLAIWFARLPAPLAESPRAERSIGGLLLLVVLIAAAAAAGALETVQHIGAMEHYAGVSPTRYQVFFLLITRGMTSFAVIYAAVGAVIVRGRRRAAGASVTQM
jgi:hypothetical protein